MTEPGIPDARVQTLRQFAALSGPFDPVEALNLLDSATRRDPIALADIASDLAQACERMVIDNSELWLMRGSERRQQLETLARTADPTAAVAAAVEQRRTALRGDDRGGESTRDLLSALTGEGVFSASGLSNLLSETADARTIEHAAEALERAGPLAPQRDRLTELRAALTGANLRERLDPATAPDFFGRQSELATIDAWLTRPAEPLTTRALYIDGLPGIGKSALLEQVARQCAADPGRWVIVRLDFDRAGLNVLDWPGLTIELARQVAAQLTSASSDLEAARRSAASTVPGAQSVSSEPRGIVPTDLGSAIARAVTGAARTILVTLDTAEVLRARGETHPHQFFSWLDQLTSFRVPVVVVAAGRGNALDSVPDRVPAKISLPGLDDHAADQLLGRLGVAPNDFPIVRSVSRGNPLALRLASKVAIEGNVESLNDVETTDEFTAAMLYRFVLSRIDDPALQRLANPGLIVRMLNADVIREVLAPNLGIANLSSADAQAMFDALAGQHWLVEPDLLAPGYVSHRSDVRAALLPLLYRSARGQSARIDRAAAAWFGRLGQPWSDVESAYHRLQLMRRDRTAPTLDPGVLAQFDTATLDELPANARDLVLRSRGARSGAYRGGGSLERGRAVDMGAVQDLRLIIDRGDWAEGVYLYEQAFKGAGYDVRSPAADTVRTFLWRTGRWSEARRLLLERDRTGADDSDVGPMVSQSPQDAACRLEMRAEFAFGRLVDSLRSDHNFAGLVEAVVSRGLRSSLASGALRLALHATGRDPVFKPDQVDPAGAAAMWWQGADAIARVQGPRLEESAGWSRISAKVGPVDGPGTGMVNRARCLAALTPFGEVAITAVSQVAPARTIEFVDGCYEAIERAGLLAPHGSPGWHDNQEPPPGSTARLQAFAEVGLLAEALGAAAYIVRDADLGLIAAASERWRRTMAGTWSYGARVSRRPPGWRDPVDHSISDRIGALRSEPSPIDRANAQLDAWCDPAIWAGSVTDHLRRRAAKTFDRAAQAASGSGGAEACARLLLRNRVPSAFVPGIAVLLEAGEATSAALGVSHREGDRA